MSNDYLGIRTYSDDCANIYTRPSPIDESEFWDFWWPLTVDGVQVGEIQITFGDGWETRLRGVDGHVVEIDDDEALLPPADENGDRVYPDED